MKKSQLKTGMVVELRSGSRGVVLKNTPIKDGIAFSKSCWTDLEAYNEQMYWIFANEDKSLENRGEHAKSVDIMKVYVPNTIAGSLGMGSKNNWSNKLKLIWERQE